MKFVGIDGEGISVKDGNAKIIYHYYVLMVANGIGTEPLVLHKDGERLTTKEIFEWLYNVVFAAHPDACFVTYAMGYDLSQWMRDLPESRARLLFTKKGIASRKRRYSSNPTPFRVYWRPDRGLSREWELDALGIKRLKLRLREREWRNYDAPRVNGDPENKAPQWMYINDVFSFFQCSFIKAIDPAPRLKAGTQSIVTAKEFETIKEGKARRSDAAFDETMIEYCAARMRGACSVDGRIKSGDGREQRQIEANPIFRPRSNRTSNDGFLREVQCR
jgi:hypothetical protein